MISKRVLALGLSLLLPLANLQAQIIPYDPTSGANPNFRPILSSTEEKTIPYDPTSCVNPFTEQSPGGIAYETGLSTGRLAATIFIGTIGVAIVAVALFNTNYCAGHHHNKNCHSSKNSNKHTHKHTHNCH